jgi:molybdate transport system permease protein
MPPAAPPLRRPPLNRASVALAGALVGALIASSGLLAGCGGSSVDAARRPIPVVGLAASLDQVGQRLAAAFEAERGDKVALHLAASGTLASQALAGAPMDAVVFAGRTPMGRLEEAKLVAWSIDLLENDLVVATAKSATDDERALARHLISGAMSAEEAASLPPGFRLAIADPVVAPAGRYAKQALERLGVWESLRPRLVLAESVAQARAWTAAGDAAAGMLYRSDVEGNAALEIAAAVPAELHDRIAYPAALLARDGAKPHPVAAAFLDYCAASPRARRLFAEAGFRMAPRESQEGNAPAARRDATPERGRFDVAGPLLLTLGVAAAAIAINALLGLPLAWLLARRDFRGKGLVETLVLLPLALPPTVIGLALVMLFGQNGPIGAFLDAWTGWTLLFTWQGAVVASSIVSFPLFVKPAQSAFEAIPKVYFEEGQLMGLGERGALLHLGLPMAWRGIACGLALGFARALGEFGATLMVAGNIPGRAQTLPLAIYSASATGDLAAAMLYASILAALALGLTLAARLLSRRGVEFDH